LLQGFQEGFQLFSDDAVAGIVEVQAVDGVGVENRGIVGVQAQVVVKIQHGDIKLLGGLQNHIHIGQQRLAGSCFFGVGGGVEVADLLAQEAAGGGHKDDGLAAVFFPEKVHKEIHSAAVGGGGGITQLAEGGIAVEIVVDAAVYDDHIGGGVHIEDTAAEAQVVAGVLAGVALVGQAGTADAVTVDGGQLAQYLQPIIVAAIGPVGNAGALCDAVAQEIYFIPFDVHIAFLRF